MERLSRGSASKRSRHVSGDQSEPRWCSPCYCRRESSKKSLWNDATSICGRCGQGGCAVTPTHSVTSGSHSSAKACPNRFAQPLTSSPTRALRGWCLIYATTQGGWSALGLRWPMHFWISSRSWRPEIAAASPIRSRQELKCFTADRW